MLGDADVLASSGEDTVVAVVLEGDESGIIGSNSGEEEKGRGDEGGDKSNGGGNRWPCQETMALLKIRSDMDAVFRDSSLKGPLWEEVSRKLAELGYSRSAKKCKEKFENVYKYHKRTKEGRSGKAEGKTYRFFDQLQALESQPSGPQSRPQASFSVTPAVPWTNGTNVSQVTVPLTTNPKVMSQNVITPNSSPIIPPIPAKNPAIPPAKTNNPVNLWRRNTSTSLFSSTSTSSSTASDQEFKESCKRKRKWKDFFQRLAKDVIEKQEALQQKFLEAIEKQENHRLVREEAWRMQEMARLNREHEMLIQERSTAAAKDAALLALLQKISGQQQPPQTHVHDDSSRSLSLSLPMPGPPPPPPPLSATDSGIQKTEGFENVTSKTSSRWPKTEVQALITLRTNLDLKYPESGPKGPLWEEISTGMRRFGYNRSAKRCKEKWENINKYFKKVKDSNIKRREDSKTCPYFHQLNALYKEKNKVDGSVDPGYVKPNNPMEPLMVQPEQQWPLREDNQQDTLMEDNDQTENVEQNLEDDNDEDTEEEDGGGGYEMVLNKSSPVENAK